MSKKNKGSNSGCVMPLVIALLAFLLFVACLYLFPQFKEKLGLGNLPTSFDEMRADQVMGYKTDEIVESVLAESRTTAKLVVLEQDVEVDMEISQMLWNIPIFEKTKMIYAYGTGGIGVDLTKLTDETVVVNHSARTVVITIDHAQVLFVEPEYEKTQYGETEHALLSFGDIKLNAQQQTVVYQDIKNAMTEKLENPEYIAQADVIATAQVKELLDPLVQAIVPGYDVTVQIVSDAKPD